MVDLENSVDLARLADPGLELRPLRGLVVLDEIQRLPDLFPLLRVLADRQGTPARVLVLGNASPELLRQTSETLEGRVAFHGLDGFDLREVSDLDRELVERALVDEPDDFSDVRVRERHGSVERFGSGPMRGAL